MRKSVVLGMVLSALMFCGGCGDPKVDASSPEALKRSVEEIGKTFDAAKREKFEKAVEILMMKNGLFVPGESEASKKKLKETFDGKTADQIIEDGEKAEAASKVPMQK